MYQISEEALFYCSSYHFFGSLKHRLEFETSIAKASIYKPTVKSQQSLLFSSCSFHNFKGFDLSIKSKCPQIFFLCRGFIHRRSLHTFEPVVLFINSNQYKSLEANLSRSFILFFQRQFLRILTLLKCKNHKKMPEIQNLIFKGFDLSTKRKIPVKLITF